MVKNISQQIGSEQMVDQLSSGIIGANAISSPPEDNAAIYRDAQISLALQRLEEDEVHNMEDKEQMIFRDGELATMAQHQEEDEEQILTEKEQWVMTSTPTGKALLLVQHVLSLHNLLSYSVPQNLGVASKVTTLAMDSMIYFWIVYSVYKRYLESPKKCHCGRKVSLHKLVIARDDLHQWIDEPHRSYHQ